ncbi:MFS transporter [Pantoea sp. Tr-811]|uniref:MFS transporter n=1 Tax=Pantoea sp. Tr-811 TaxID=2608361 RepID=UPI00141EED0F|nr:MFS transporter [Pantoea sp. Tr-811]NIF30325.1 MFS transporter [Pantoea sp. Tr-811]
MPKISITPATITIFSGVVAAVHLGKVSPAIPLLQEALGLSLVQAGFLLSLMQIAGMLAGMLIGYHCDRLGPRASLLIGQGILCVASFAGSLSQDVYQLLALRAFESLGFLMVVLPTPGLLRRIVPHNRLALHLGLWGCYMALGTSVAFFSGPIFLQFFSWRIWWCMAALTSAIIIHQLWARLPHGLSRAHRAGAQAMNPLVHMPLRSQIIAHLKGRDTWYIGIAFAMYAGQWLAVIGFLPSIYATAGVSPTKSAPLTAIAALANIFGNIAAALLLHRGVNTKTLLTIGYVGMTVMSLAAFIPLTGDMPVLRYCAVIVYSGIGGVIPGSLYLLAINATPNERQLSSTFGRVQQLTSTGMFLMPPLLARLAYLAGGWHWTWLATSFASILGLVLVSRLASKKNT